MPVATLAAAAALVLAAAAPAAAGVAHVVQPGETLWSIAQANGLSVAEVAAANGLSAEAHVLAGQTVTIPPAGGEVAAAPAPSAAAGSYVVQPGDTLGAIAERAGLSVASLAAANGLAVDGVLVSGTALALSGTPVQQVAAPAASAPVAAPEAAPAPTGGGSVSAADIASVAAQHGVPGSLAAAVAWQESGFNNAMVSSAGARGVMQVMPDTWSFVQENLGTGALDPASPLANVTAGSAYLSHLLERSGGDPTTAIAGYYQGPASVAAHGILPETQRYVDNVMALQGRFGG